MENGVQALKIAFSMLIFVLAITITISSLTSAVQALNRIFGARDSEKYVTNASGDFLNFVDLDLSSGGIRQVGIETIVPSIYRAYKENFAIYFYKNVGGVNQPLVLYETFKDGATIQVNYIDLEKEIHASAESAIENINDLLENGNSFFPNGLYEYLGTSTRTFTEMLGEYYMDDIKAGGNDVADVNKIKKRVIIYIEN